MRIDSKKLDMAMANACVGNLDIATALDMSTSWVGVQLGRARRGENLMPKTVGVIAAAIGCPVEDLLADEAGKGESA